MLSTILEKVVSELERNVFQSINGTVSQSIRLLNQKNGEDRLHPNAVNLVLFGTKAEREMMSTPSYGMSRANSTGLRTKPPLKLTVDLLFIFNFEKYEVALSAYSRVLEYFYNHDLISVPFEGQENEIEILLSFFTAKEEIKLWSSFNIPGTPILRYDLKYANILWKKSELANQESIELG